jgi:RNA polymerase-associated protein
MIMPKRSSITCLSDHVDLSNHRARIALAEKGVSAEVEYVDLANPTEDFLSLNPYHTLPVLIDRDLVLNQSNIIIEYLDERFPHPPLLPVYPVARARTRLMIYRIEQDWYVPAQNIEQGIEVEKSREQLRDQIIKVIPAFNEMPFFLSPEFSLVDCTIAPVLWRLPHYGIVLPEKGKPVLDYAERIFARPSFKASLSDQEIDMREDFYDI